MIRDALNHMEDLDQADWVAQKKRLVKKRKQLEVMLQATGKTDLERARDGL